MRFQISNLKFEISILAIFLLFTMAADLCRADERITLDVWAMGVEGKKLNELASEFEKENPRVRVVIQAIPWGAAHEKLITAVAGESTPDVCQLGTTWVSEFQAMNVLLPLDDLIGGSMVRGDQFFESSWKVGQIGGKVYGIPWYVDTRVLFYRKDLLAQAGFDKAPRTWDELLKVSRALAVDDDKDGKRDRYAISLPLRDWAMACMFIWQNGGNILSHDRSFATINRMEAVEAFDYYLNFFKEDLAPRELAIGTDIFHSFDKGYLPMFISGPWMLSEIHEQLPHLAGKWSVATLPENKHGTSFVGGSSLVIFRNTRKAELAWKFVEFLSRPQTQVRWFQITEDLPASRAAWKDPHFEDLEMVKVFGRQLHDTRSAPSIPEWERIANIIENGMERAIFGKDTVAEALDRMAVQIGAVLKRDDRAQSALFKLSILGLFGGLVAFLLFVYFYFTPSRTAFDPTSLSRKGKFTRYIKSYGFIFPSLGILTVFLLAPVFISLLMSFTDWDIKSIVDVGRLSFVGLDNYGHLAQDPVFRRALWNTFIFVLAGGPMTIITALFFAMALNSGLMRFRTFFRVGFFTPVVTTMVAVAVVWRWLYNARFGLINWGLDVFGIEGINWLGDANWALPALMMMAVWKNFGYHMVIFLAGLQGIPPHLYEAAHIDGANRLKSFFYITVPLLKPTIFFVGIMTSIGYFQFFAEPYIMTDGGPLNSTVSVILHMYREGFKYFHMGYASAIAYVLFLAIAMFSLVQFRMNKQTFEY